MSKTRQEAIKQTLDWLQRNEQLQVIEQTHTSDFDEYFIKDEDGIVTQVYLSDNVQLAKEV